MFRYPICDAPDEEVFKKQCVALENRISNLNKEDLLQDVDGTLIQTYYLAGKKLMVKNSHYVGSVYIESEFDIDPYFEKKD